MAVKGPAQCPAADAPSAVPASDPAPFPASPCPASSDPGWDYEPEAEWDGDPAGRVDGSVPGVSGTSLGPHPE